jgi:hypothetical protein
METGFSILDLFEFITSRKALEEKLAHSSFRQVVTIVCDNQQERNSSSRH